jgi:hypothetical protein
MNDFFRIVALLHLLNSCYCVNGVSYLASSFIQVYVCFPFCFILCPIKKLRGFSPQANYTDRAIAAGQRS